MFILFLIWNYLKKRDSYGHRSWDRLWQQKYVGEDVFQEDGN